MDHPQPQEISFSKFPLFQFLSVSKIELSYHYSHAFQPESSYRYPFQSLKFISLIPSPESM